MQWFGRDLTDDFCLLLSLIDRVCKWSNHSQCFCCSWGKRKYWTGPHESSMHPTPRIWGILVLAWYLKCSSKNSFFFSFTHYMPFNQQNTTPLSVIQLSQLGPSHPSPIFSILFKSAEWKGAQSQSGKSVVTLISVRSITQKPKPLCTPEPV